MKISWLAGIVLGIAMLLMSLGMMADYGIIAKPLTPLERAQKQLEESGVHDIESIEETTTLELAEKSIDFGLQEEGVKLEREFKFKNVGQNPLQILGIRPSCSCISIKERELKVAPGETGTLTVGINTEGLSGPVEKYVLLRTNDPEHSELSIAINAVVTVPIEINPRRIVFSRLLANDTVSRDVQVFTRIERPFEIKSVRLTKPDIAGFFEVTFRPLEASELPEEAKSGWNVTVTVKPGLSTGNFKQLVSLATSDEKMPEVMFDVEGNVVNDISVVAIGADFNPKFNLLSLGALRQAQGGKARLKLLVAGEYRDKLELGEPVCDPDFLRVTIGERKSINKGTASEIPLEIEIPAGSPIISLLGTEQDGVGRVTIPTNHSSMKKVEILLHFAIEK